MFSKGNTMKTETMRYQTQQHIYAIEPDMYIVPEEHNM